MRNIKRIDQLCDIAIEIAKKDINLTHEDTYEAYVLAAIAEEEKIIKKILESRKGQSVIERMSNRIYQKLQVV